MPEAVRGRHQRLEIGIGPKPWIDLQIILDAVAVIRRLKGHLLEDRTEPDRRHAHPFQVAKLARDSGECAADIAAARVGHRAASAGVCTALSASPGANSDVVPVVTAFPFTSW